MRTSILSAALLFAAAPSRALACGGMFCDAAAPVDQAAERIFFFFEPDTDDDGLGLLTTEVQISYVGESDGFAWVVPVPAEPDIFLSNDAMFTAIANATTPVYSLITESSGSVQLGCASENNMSGKADFDSAEEGGDGVSVVSSEAVGPYDTVVLQAENADRLVTWLQDEGYAVPDGMEVVLAPYVAAGQYFVALKLQSDKDSGDIAPIAMTYPAAAASIPIQLTAVAAVDDMPIEVFVYGPSRAVPDNYLHVQINDAAINWYTGADNYREVVTSAVDEAGGQAFATDYSAPAGDLSFVLDLPSFDLDQMRGQPVPTTWLELILFSGITASTQLTNLMLELVPPPDGVDPLDFLSCPSCYEVDATDWDPEVATDRFEADVLDVMEGQQDRMAAASQLTRLFTTMDASEMTADPVFVFNPKVTQDIAATRFATSVERQAAFSGEAVSRTLTLADGRAIVVPDASDFDALTTLATPAALVIEDYSATGEPEAIADFTDAAAADAEAFNAGCSDTAAIGLPALLLAAGILRRRRAE